MSEEEIDNILKYQEELEKKYGVHHFKMYFEDGGELDVVEYDKFLDLQQENKLLKEQFDMIYKGKKLKLLSIEKCKNKYCFNYELESGENNNTK